jgi:hypothetical protein
MLSAAANPRFESVVFTYFRCLLTHNFCSRINRSTRFRLTLMPLDFNSSQTRGFRTGYSCLRIFPLSVRLFLGLSAHAGWVSAPSRHNNRSGLSPNTADFSPNRLRNAVLCFILFHKLVLRYRGFLPQRWTLLFLVFQRTLVRGLPQIRCILLQPEQFFIAGGHCTGNTLMLLSPLALLSLSRRQRFS